MRKPNDWELMAQKKDIEEIKKILIDNLASKTKERKNAINILRKAIVSVALTSIATIITTISLSLFQENHYETWVYILCIIFIIIIACIPFFRDLVKLFYNKEIVPKEDINEMVDMFDNDIIYNALTSLKYLDLYDSTIDTIEKRFYNNEIKYLIRKILYQLNKIEQRAVCDSFTCDNFKTKKILKERIEVVFKLVENVETKINDQNFSKEISDSKKTIIAKFNIK